METLFDKKVKTRKAHKCWGCKEDIPTGTLTQKVTTVDGGEICTTYWCNRCDKFLSDLPREDLEDGFDFGDLLNYDNYPKKEAKL